MFTKGWTKSAEEIKKIEETLRTPIFADVRWLAVQYLTRPEIVREVLPPPLEPAAEPLVTLGIGTLGRSNCTGAFAGGMLCVRAPLSGGRGRFLSVDADVDRRSDNLWARAFRGAQETRAVGTRERRRRGARDRRAFRHHLYVAGGAADQ